jgi:spermidine synthase
MKPLRTIESVETKDGTLSLKQRDVHDFLITVGGRVLMTSTAHRSEVALGAVACKRLATFASPRVLVGGLGMGFTLRAVLDRLPKGAKVVVAELNPVVEQWCRGPLAHLTDKAVEDPRVTVAIEDVSKSLNRAANSGLEEKFDAIVIDLYVGPDAGTTKSDPLYGAKAVDTARRALKSGGIFAIWGEAFDAGFARRLEKVGFTVRHEKPGKGGLKHVIYIAQRAGS